MNLNNEDQLIEFINHHTDLKFIEKHYQFKKLPFSIEDLLEFAKKKSIIESFIDPKETDREGIYLIKNGQEFEVKELNHGFWGSIGKFRDLKLAIFTKLNEMQAAHFFKFKN